MEFLILWIVITIFIGTVIACSARWLGPGVIIGAYTGALVTAIVVVGKFGVIPGFPDIALSASIFVYSATFIFTDVLSEVWGAKVARKAVWAGAMIYPLLFATLQFSISWEPHMLWAENQEAFATLMTMAIRITIASFLAFVVSQIYDIWVFDFWKRKTGGRHLWFRNNASTMVSQLIDTVVFYTIAFYGIFPVVTLIIATYIVKLVIAAIDTPFVYFASSFIKKGKNGNAIESDAKSI